MPAVETPSPSQKPTPEVMMPPKRLGTTPSLWKRHHYPLGATCTGDGVNFALFSEDATGVELCLFDSLGELETARVRFTECANFVWHGFLPHLQPGQLY